MHDLAALEMPLRAARETAEQYGVKLDRTEILQHANTLVMRLAPSLVARVVLHMDGPRHGIDWFSRETAVAQHLASHAAPVIPLHPDLPPGPHCHLGFTMNFWRFVQASEAPPVPAEIGATLFQCHAALRSFAEPLPHLAILKESLSLLPNLSKKGLFPHETARLLSHHLETSLTQLADVPHQPLHGDAHYGNLLYTTDGLLWTDWEDAFAGPIEWDVASSIWNAKILDGDAKTSDAIVAAYQAAGGSIDPIVLHQCLIARAAVMSTWYPILYPRPDASRQAKLQARLDWLRGGALL